MIHVDIRRYVHAVDADEEIICIRNSMMRCW